jgi:hypothetical protein
MSAGLVAGCGVLPLVSGSPEAVERMPGPAYVWLTSDPSAPISPVDVTMTAPDPGVLFAHTFETGAPLRGSFVTSEGRYLLSALAGACRVPLVLGADDEAQVVLTIASDGTCSFTVTWQGNVGAAGRPAHGDGVLITNHDAGDATPRIEGGWASPRSVTLSRTATAARGWA